MKWNDKYLPYSGENKSIIYNYLISVTKELLFTIGRKNLNNVYVINFILNDKNWDRNIFGTKEKHDWFLTELKNNPFLLDFVNSEITKILDLPDIYSERIKSAEELDNSKTSAFAKIVQTFVVESPTVRHFYFNSIDLDEARKTTDEFVKANFRKFRCKRSILEYKYLKAYKVKKILETEMQIETEIIPTNGNGLVLVEKNSDFIVNISRWGDFPIVSKKPQKNELFCMMDEISIYVFGLVTPQNIKKFSDDYYLFAGENPKLEHLTGFFGFNNEIFITERGMPT